MLALIKNTFLKKIFLQCFLTFKHAFENFFFSFFFYKQDSSEFAYESWWCVLNTDRRTRFDTDSQRRPALSVTGSSWSDQSKKSKMKIKYPTASNLHQTHHRLTYCNWILQVGLVWKKQWALSIHTGNANAWRVTVTSHASFSPLYV